MCPLAALAGNTERDAPFMSFLVGLPERDHLPGSKAPRDWQ